MTTRVFFDHEDLRVYKKAIGFVAWLEGLDSRTMGKASARDHLDRASAGIPVNIAEASGKRSMKDRRNYIDIAYGSSLECAACLDVLVLLGCLTADIVDEGKDNLVSLISMLIGFRKSTEGEVRDERAEYTAVGGAKDRVFFAHETLDVYRRALVFVVWFDRLHRSESLPRSTLTALDKSSTSAVLNIAEGNGKFSIKDRCRFIGHARTAVLQSAAMLDVLMVRQKKAVAEISEGKQILSDTVRMLVAWESHLMGNR